MNKVRFDIPTKKLSLDFLGESWKENDCYIEFMGFTTDDFLNNMESFVGKMDETENIAKGIKATINLLQERFVSGKGMSEGEVIDLKQEDIKYLPAEVLMKATSFLSQTLVEKNETP